MDSVSVIAPEVDRVLEVLADREPAAAKRACANLGRLAKHCPTADDSRRFSHLTGDGFPIEFTFTSSGHGIRYTAELAGPDSPPTQRLDGARQWISDDWIDQFHAIQNGHDLRYGCWLGARHDGSADRYKLYVEIPDSAADLAARMFLKQPLQLPGTAPPKLRMIGCNHGADGVELYFRLGGMQAWQISNLLRVADMHDRTSTVKDLIREMWGRSIDQGLPGSTLGCSYVWDGEGRIRACSLFFFARALFGGDGMTRRRVLELASSYGWDFEAYGRITASLEGRYLWKTYHGMVGIVLAPDELPQLHVGLRPPPATP